MTRHARLALLSLLAIAACAISAAADDARPRKIVLVAGTKSHGPGHHEYEKGARLLAACLDGSPNAPPLVTEVHTDGWPADEKTFDDADTIFFFCDGSDRDPKAHPLLVGDRLATIERQMQRGCGLVALHYTIFVPNDRGGPQLLDWIGGYFDYQSGPGERGWYSKIGTHATKPRPATTDHPICRGLAPFDLNEEYYYNLRFREGDKRLTPILMTEIPGERQPQVVAYAVERAGGGRGFGFSGGHFHANWQGDNFRKMVLNALLWTAKAEVPAGGVKSTLPEEPKVGADDTRPIKTLLVTGHQHPAHAWRETTPALVEALAGRDPRFKVSVEEDPEFLARDALRDFDLVVLNYCNWQRPGLSEAARQNFVKYLAGGGGLAIIHFANGAFHFSLPGSGEGDWPEYRTKICRRVWDHTPGRSGHDAYGPFRVDVADAEHEITRGLKPYETTDELYYRQQGDEPIHVLATAHSRDTGRDEPMAFVYDYGKGRVFQTVLGHDAAAIRNPGTAELVRRACAWTAGRKPAAAAAPTAAPDANKKALAPAPAAPKLVEARLPADGQTDLAPADPALKVILLDRSPTESFLAVKTDTAGRIFVGGREALFVYEPDTQGGYRPRRVLFRFPPDSWLFDIEIRGDDLYVMTSGALYLLPGARLAREDIQPRRLIWGIPIDLHISYHGLAWGAEGDLYFCSGDPLLNYGDFARADHWGHWTIYSQPEGTKTEYTGVGGVFRCRPDGSRFEVVAGGTRGSGGLAFDRDWNLFTNDNDHESLPQHYVPARLLHVTPQSDFGWPRGWMAEKTPDRADLLTTMFTGMGREVPVGQTYYDEDFLPAGYRHNLLVAEWGRLAVARYSLAPRGASFAAEEHFALSGRNHARPVGLCVGRGGRLFATVAYMAHNEGSPVYASDLVMATRADDAPNHPFAAYDAPTAPSDVLWRELGDASWWRRNRAHQELLRRGGDLVAAAVRRLANASPDEPISKHLVWLGAASDSPEARLSLVALACNVDSPLRVQALRALARSPHAAAERGLFAAAIAGPDPAVQLVALAAWFDLPDPPIEAIAAGPALSRDTYLRQTATRLLARRATLDEIARLCRDADAAARLAGVLAAGTRLTVPPATGPVPDELPLTYTSANAIFDIQYAGGERIDIRKLARVGSFTMAEWWRAVPHSPEHERLFDLLKGALDDADQAVRLQAAYYLYLLADRRTEEAVARVAAAADEQRLAAVPLAAIDQAWIAGPFGAPDTSAGEGSGDDASDAGADTPESGAVELAAEYRTSGGAVRWQTAAATGGFFDLGPLAKGDAPPTFYAYCRLQSGAAQRVSFIVASSSAVKVWLNGRAAYENAVVAGKHRFANAMLLALEPGSNDILVRVRDLRAATGGDFGMELKYTGLATVTAAMPEKLGLATLAERLKASAGGDQRSGGAQTDVPREFLAVDWSQAARTGDAERGRKLFGGDALACVKCHAIVPGQAAAGGPSLAEAAKRFTPAHLVESVLLPSREVAPAFRATQLVTADGRIETGLVVGETAERIDLLLANATKKTFAKADIAERHPSDISPMPTGLVKTPDELRDLLAYVLSANPQPP